MTTDAVAGIGTVLKKKSSADSSGAYAVVGEINSISGPNQSKSLIDVTSLDSTGNRREFIGSFIDSGEISLEMNFTRAGFKDFKVDLESSVLEDYQIIFPDPDSSAVSTTLTFSGVCTALGTAVPLDDKITQTVTVKITGEVTVTP